MWLEVAEKSIKCERCDRQIIDGEVLMRFGVAKSAEAQIFCADCFERMSNKLSQDFDSLRLAGKIQLKDPVQQKVEVKCFTCGMKPEDCHCGSEAYR